MDITAITADILRITAAKHVPFEVHRTKHKHGVVAITGIDARSISTTGGARFVGPQPCDPTGNKSVDGALTEVIHLVSSGVGSISTCFKSILDK